ncbi:MAG TPA: SdiA-regulated domain-containing protein [Mucilaginibacter sp.]|nr:SdiA-regulated domain-containing protein [Mucilaginibacter sp.]
MKIIAQISLFVLVLAGMLSACKQKSSFRSPDGFDFDKPLKYNLPGDLTEISGITFSKGKSDVIYCENDEEGKVYYLKPGEKTARSTAFKESGDFEDIAACGSQIVMLQSKGTLFTMPLTEIGKSKTVTAKKWNDLLPEGEYEGMYADENANQVYVLCKHCSIDKTSKQSSGFIFQVTENGDVKSSGDFKLNVKHIEDLLHVDKINFHPSALARSPVSHDWYVLSSVNKLLVIADEKWKIRDVYTLNPDFFTQPEGMAFDADNNLYISNEGHFPESANILKFQYKKAGE